jgi:hypothetical protein
MSRKAPAIHTASEAAGRRLVPGPIATIEARLGSLRS